MTYPHIKALFFDLGNVILYFDHQIHCQKLATLSRKQPEKIYEFVSNDEILKYENKIFDIHKSAANKTCAGNDFLGWFDLPEKIMKV